MNTTGAQNGLTQFPCLPPPPPKKVILVYSLWAVFCWCDQGKVEVTIAGGRIVWENGQLKVVPGAGKYIEMAPFSYVFDGIDKADSNYLASLRAPVQRFKSST